MTSTAKQLSHLRAVEQAQQSLERAAVARSAGKSASIKSISECIHFSNALSLSSYSVSLSSRFSRISLAGSRRQLSIRNNELKGESDEPDAPLLLDRELAVRDGDVVIGRKQGHQTDHEAGEGLDRAMPRGGRYQSKRQGNACNAGSRLTRVRSLSSAWAARSRSNGSRCAKL
jgi:hypothetical protein